MRNTLPVAALLALAVGLAGCGAGGTTAPDVGISQDESDVSMAIASDPELVDDGLIEAADATGLDAEPGGAALRSGAGAEALIHPLNFWRHINQVQRRYEFAFADTDSTGRPTRVVVTIHKLMSGSFNIAAGPSDPASATDSARIVRKRLQDEWTRRVMLERGEDRLRRRGERLWRIVASSGVQVTSRVADAPRTRIRSMRVQTAGLDTTLTDPLALMRLRNVLKFDPDADVELTVTTDAPDDVVLLLHREARFRFHSNGDNTYSGKWHAPLREGFRHVGVNALSHGTLFDDEAPYSSQAWIVPYVVRGGEPVAALED